MEYPENVSSLLAGIGKTSIILSKELMTHKKEERERERKEREREREKEGERFYFCDMVTS